MEQGDPYSNVSGFLIRRWSRAGRGTPVEQHVMMKVETGVMLLQTKEPQRWPANHQKVGQRKEGFLLRL